MNLTGVIAISGKPGLYKVIAQAKNNIIVESVEDKKRVPAYSSDRISALDDISIYTTDDDKPLKDIFTAIFEKEGGKACISHKEDPAKLKKYLLEVLPNFDQDRVYGSDIKKIFQWYNLLLKAGLLVVEKEEKKATKSTKAAKEKADDATEVKAEAEKKTPAKKAPAKTTAKKVEKSATPKAAPKASSAKKVAAPKTGSSRGK